VEAREDSACGTSWAYRWRWPKLQQPPNMVGYY